MDEDFIPIKSPAEKEFRLNINLKIRRKFLLYILLPIVVIGLAVFGLVKQGFIGGSRTATVTLQVVGEKPVQNSLAISSAIVEVGSLHGITNADGFATITGEINGRSEKTQISIRKTGYLPYAQDYTLKAGKNAIGKITLKEAPVAKIDLLTIQVKDYISDEPVSDAVVALGDIGGFFNKDNVYQLPNVPLGAYTLTISKSNYNAFSSKITVDKDTKKLDDVSLVPSGTIVFESNRDGGKRGIFTANYDGSSQKALIERVGVLEDFTPVLGPNQRKLFFTSTRDGIKRENDPNTYKEFMYVVDIDGKNLNKVSETSGSYAVWSPDGGYIGLTKYTEDYSKSELYTYDVLHKTAHEFSDYNSSSFSFSQDGKLIAFGGKKEGQPEYRLFYANSDGSNIKEVAVGDTSNSFSSMEFTTNGKLRYSRWDSAARKNRWYEYDLTSGTITEVTAPAVDREGAILSPNKKLRAYVSTRDGKTNVYISDSDSKNEKKLTDLNKVVGNLLWSKDGSFIMFDYRSDDESARYLVSINGTAKAKKIVDINLTYYY